MLICDHIMVNVSEIRLGLLITLSSFAFSTLVRNINANKRLMSLLSYD
jgi:hypothetical protein